MQSENAIKFKKGCDKKFHFDNDFFNDPKLYEDVSLYQIGDLSCNGGYEIPDHEQFCYEISYIVSGKGVYYTNNKSYPVEEGCIYLCLPGDHHGGVADSIDPFRYFYLGFSFCRTPQDDKDPFVHIKKMFDQVKNPVMQDKLGIRSYFVNTLNEMLNIKDNSYIMIRSYLNQIIMLTYRNFFEGWDNAYMPEKLADSSADAIVYQVISFIDNNLCNIQEFSRFSEKLGYSYSYISHLFSKETGLSIQQYYNKKRFEKAVEWLKSGNMSITDIASQLRYQSIHSFSKAFRKSAGIPPSQYQELYNKKHSVINK